MAKTVKAHKPIGKDVIIIVRHGRPALSKKQSMNWQGFRIWWNAYDAGGLTQAQKIPRKVRALAADADIIISSPLRRAVESAQRASGRDPDEIWPELIEASLPSPPLGALRLRPKAWGTLARIVWYLGWSDGMESHSAARLRADFASDKLGDAASGGKLVFVTAHGWYNRMLKDSLIKRGWVCVSQNGDLHWSFRRFERITKGDSQDI